MKDLDDSIMLNNVGIGGTGRFNECPAKSCWDQGIVNMVEAESKISSMEAKILRNRPSKSR
jgi:hypothetical protein